MTPMCIFVATQFSVQRFAGAGTGTGDGNIDVISPHAGIRRRTNSIAEVYAGDDTTQVVAGFIDATPGITSIGAYGEQHRNILRSRVHRRLEVARAQGKQCDFGRRAYACGEAHGADTYIDIQHVRGILIVETSPMAVPEDSRR